jgi:hypothetical protein
MEPWRTVNAHVDAHSGGVEARNGAVVGQIRITVKRNSDADPPPCSILCIISN